MSKLTESELAAEKAELEATIVGHEVGLDRQRNFNIIKADSDAQTFEEAMAEFEAQGFTVDVADSTTVGDGYDEFDQSQLINVPFLLQAWTISRPENETYGTPYLVIRGITKDGRKFRFVDGSTGVCRELMKLTEKRFKEGHSNPNAGLMCPKGLSLSSYPFIDPVTQETGTAKTYHIAL